MFLKVKSRILVQNIVSTATAHARSFKTDKESETHTVREHTDRTPLYPEQIFLSALPCDAKPADSLQGKRAFYYDRA